VRYDQAADHPSVCGVEIDSPALEQGELRVRVAFASPVPLNPPVAGLVVTTREGRPIFGTNMRMHPPVATPAASRGVCTLSVPRLPLHSDTYGLSVWLGDRDRDYDAKADALFFDFVALRETTGRPRPGGVGPLDLDCQWSMDPL
jgi:lipopolysaccharide transport system ATP-binding protein